MYWVALRHLGIPKWWDSIFSRWELCSRQGFLCGDSLCVMEEGCFLTNVKVIQKTFETCSEITLMLPFCFTKYIPFFLAWQILRLDLSKSIQKKLYNEDGRTIFWRPRHVTSIIFKAASLRKTPVLMELNYFFPKLDVKKNSFGNLQTLKNVIF